MLYHSERSCHSWKHAVVIHSGRRTAYGITQPSSHDHTAVKGELNHVKHVEDQVMKTCRVGPKGLLDTKAHAGPRNSGASSQL